MKKQRILTWATLHYHNWTPGTQYWELEHDVIDMWKTVNSLSKEMNIDRPTYAEFKQLLKEAAE